MSESLPRFPQVSGFVERGHTDVEVEHKLFVHRSDGGKEAHERPKFGSEHACFCVAPKVTIAPEAEAILGGLTLDYEVHRRDERVYQLRRLSNTLKVPETSQKKTTDMG